MHLIYANNKKIFPYKDFEDCARVLILSYHNNFYRVIKKLTVSEVDVTNQKQHKCKLQITQQQVILSIVMSNANFFITFYLHIL